MIEIPMVARENWDRGISTGVPLKWFACFAALLATHSISADEQVLLRCGSHCLYVAAGILDKAPASLQELEEILGEPERKGYSLQKLADGARKIGLEAIPVRTTIDNLIAREERFVCIAHLAKGHFVIFSDVSGQSIQVIDPPGNSILPIQTVKTLWDGTALLVSSSPLMSEEDLSQRRKLAAVGKVAACAIGLLSAAGVGWILIRKRRRLNLIGYLLVSVLSGALAGCHRSGSVSDNGSDVDAETGPQIGFDSHQFDLGELELTADRDRQLPTIRVRNSGTAPLLLAMVKLSCGCTSALPRKSVLRSGEETDIDVEVSVKEPGEHAVSLEVHSNCVKTPVARLGIRWNATGPFELDFPEIDFGRLRPGAVEKRTVRLLKQKPTVCPDAVFSSFHSKSQNPQLQALIDDGESFTVHVTAGSVPERHHEVLVLNLSNCWQDVVRVPVRWEVSPPVSVTPRALFLGSVGKNERVHRMLVLEAPEGRVDVDASSSTTAFAPEVTLKRFGEAKLLISIEFAAPDEPGPFETQFDLHVTTPELCELRIPVSGVVANENTASK